MEENRVSSRTPSRTDVCISNLPALKSTTSGFSVFCSFLNYMRLSDCYCFHYNHMSTVEEAIPNTLVSPHNMMLLLKARQMTLYHPVPSMEAILMYQGKAGLLGPPCSFGDQAACPTQAQICHE